MAKEATIILDVPIPKGLKEHLTHEILQEMLTAKKKWNVSMVDEDNLVEQSLKQLKLKMEYLTGHEWSYDQESSLVNLHEVLGRTRNLNLAKTRIPDLWVIRSRTGWEEDHSNGQADDAFLLEDFPEEFSRTLTNFVRTASFYGVASYS